MNDKPKYYKFKEMFRALKNVMAVLVWIITAILPFVLNQLYDLLVSESQSRFGLFGIYGIFIGSSIIIFIIFLIVHYFYNKNAQVETFRDEIAIIRNINENGILSDEFDVSKFLQRCKELLVANNDLLISMGIVDLRGLTKIESKVPTRDVWILSADLYSELNDTLFKSIVKKNIARGISYTYFYANRDGESVKADKLKIAMGSSQSHIDCIPLDNEKYKLLFSFADILLYDPLSEKTTVYLGIGADQLTENALYIKLDDNAVAIILETLSGEYHLHKKA